MIRTDTCPDALSRSKEKEQGSAMTLSWRGALECGARPRILIMSKVHVFPLHQRAYHDTEHGADCICEPKVFFNGKDNAGEDAIVFIHGLLSEECISRLRSISSGL
jgi:hypothetical protein